MTERESIQAWIHAGGITLVFWVVTPLCLFLLGWGLGYFTLILTQRSWANHRYITSALNQLVRLLYRLVILLSVVYFYFFIPVLVFGIWSAVGGNVYLSYLTPAASERLALIKIVFLVAIGFTIATFLPVLASTFFSQPKRPTGRRFLTREEAPQLWGVVDEVANRVGTRPVDMIYISPDAIMGVSEHGVLRQRLRGKSERELLLGFGSLPGMTQIQFKAILAHEYGHFVHHDTAGGGWAFQVRNATSETMIALAEQAVDAGFLLWTALLFLICFLVGCYYRLVLFPITMGASRLQELSADRCAAGAYGAAAFAEGLNHIVRQKMIFDAQVNQEEQEARTARRKLKNLYTLPPLASEIAQKVAPLLEKETNRATSVYDTHPAPHERIHMLENLPSPTGEEANQEAVWNLLSDAESLQMEMTGIIQYMLYSRFGHSWART